MIQPEADNIFFALSVKKQKKRFCVVSRIDKEVMVFVIKIMAMVVTEDISVVKNLE